MPSSRIPGFYKLSVDERVERLQDEVGLTDDQAATLHTAIDPQTADRWTENVVGTYALPLGVATNFTVNGEDVLVPMAIEESSVVAAASHGAKIARQTGGFEAEATDPTMIGQIQLLDVDHHEAREAIEDAEDDLLREANEVSQTLRELGAGAQGIEYRQVPTAAGEVTLLHLLVDVQDAMGANVVNSMCERIAPMVESLTDGRVRLRILSNLADRRTVKARATFPADELGGDDAVQGIFEAWALAAEDPYRAATHNKGTMNGIDAVAVATGNDWRAIEAGAHAYAAKGGKYGSLTRFVPDDDGDLVGEIEVPLALGVVGGLTAAHPVAQVALEILDVETARELAEVAASVGLAQNLAALRALAQEGIQEGHMALHAENLASLAGAEGDQVEQVAERMVEAGDVSMSRARELVKDG